MKGTLAAFPDCWRPLNWSRFEEALQDLVLGQDNLALNARTAYLNITLDCVQTSRIRIHQQGVAPDKDGGESSAGAAGLPQLFLGAGGDRDGRAAVKRCSKWAAKIWARRASTGTDTPAAEQADGFSTETNARVCAAAARALGEALQAYVSAGVVAAGGGGVGSGVELEGCRLVAVELESHGEAVVVAGGTQNVVRGATAQCRAGLMRSLGARPFCPTLAGALLENMPTKEDGCVEVECLKALLRRQQERGEGSKRGRRVRGGKGKSEESGSAMLFADMDLPE